MLAWFIENATKRVCTHADGCRRERVHSQQQRYLIRDCKPCTCRRNQESTQAVHMYI